MPFEILRKINSLFYLIVTKPLPFHFSNMPVIEYGYLHFDNRSLCLKVILLHIYFLRQGLFSVVLSYC